MCLVSRQLYTVHCHSAQVRVSAAAPRRARTGWGARYKYGAGGGYFGDRKLSGVSGAATTEENHFRSVAGLNLSLLVHNTVGNGM
jgi:hypothetical protein